MEYIYICIFIENLSRASTKFPNNDSYFSIPRKLSMSPKRLQ